MPRHANRPAPRRLPAAIWLLLATAILWPAWLVWGLRYTTHDDLALSLVALNPEIGWLAFADVVARLQARVQAYLSIPVWLLGTWLAEFGWADLVFSGQIVLILALSVILVRGMAGIRAALLLALLLGHGFALHAFFTAPPGFQLFGLSWAGCFLVTLLLVRRAARGARGVPLAAGVVWLLVMNGPEYNVVTYLPALVVAILLWVPAWPARARYIGFFIALSGLYLLGAFAFRFLAGSTGNEDGRVALSLSAAWWPTFLTLLGNALLPSAMLSGLRLDLAPVGGMPALPSRLDAVWLGRALLADPWHLGAFGLYAAAIAFALGGNPITRRLRLGLAVAALGIMLAPPAVLALSALYQHTVLQGHLQGHLATANIQAGAALLLVALLAGHSWRPWARVALALPVAALCTATLVYNLAMRDALSANRQRWDAFALLAATAPERPVFAPDFWTTTGVSEAPQPLMPQSGQYWNDRARDVHRTRMTLRDRDAVAAPDDIRAGYAVSPRGHPALWIEAGGAFRLVTRVPGPWSARGASGTISIEADAFTCGSLCETALPDGFVPAAPTAWLRPGVAGDASLPQRLLLGRTGAFGAW